MRQGTPKTILLLSLAVGSAVTLFCTPLILRYRYFKEYSLSLTTSDMMAVNERMSSVWCESQKLSMDTHFNAYLLPPGEPPMSTQKRKSVFNEHVVLSSGDTEVWGFYLIEGSVLTLSTCHKLSGAVVTIIKGSEPLLRCLDYHQKHLNDDVSLESGESSETAEEIDDKEETHESTVSSSEGVNSNETEGHEFDCHEALAREEFKRPSTCFRSHASSSSSPHLAENGTLSSSKVKPTFDGKVKLHAHNSEHYYVVFSSAHVELDEINKPLSNEIYGHFEIDRMVYDVSQATRNCTESLSCSFDVSFGKPGFVVVQYNPISNETDTLTSDVLASFCEPRKGLYFCFYLLLFLVIFISAFQ